MKRTERRKVAIAIAALSFALVAIGLSVLVRASGWGAAVGVFLFVWGNNIATRGGLRP